MIWFIFILNCKGSRPLDHFNENILDINVVCLNSKCSIAPQRHLAVEMSWFNQFISVATYQNDSSLLAKRIHAIWFCFPTNLNHLTLVTHTYDSYDMSHHDFLNVKIFSISTFWTITSLNKFPVPEWCSKNKNKTQTADIMVSQNLIFQNFFFKT